MNIVRKSISGKAGGYATKRTVNLAKRESQKKNIMTLAVGTAVIAVLAIVVVKFGVTSQFDRLDAAASAYNDVHRQHVAMEEALDEYPEVVQEYHTYSRDWMTSDPSLEVSVDRQEVLDLLEANLMAHGTVNTFQVEENVVLANMSGMNLQEISTMFEEIQKQPIVDNAKLTIASTANKAGEVLDFSVTITLAGEEEEEE